AGIEAVLAGEQETFYLEYPCHSPNQQRWFYMKVSPLQGSRRGVVVSHKNITERKKAEEVAHAASQYARSLIEASLDPLVTISAEGKITDVNTATEQVTGVDRYNLIGSDFADYFTNPEKAREGYQQVFSQGFVTDYPLAIRHVSGKVTDVLYNASVYRDGDGNVLGVFAAARDITEHKAMEEELKNSEAKFRSIIEVSPVPMALNDEQMNITFLNQAFVQTFGYTLDDIPTVADWWPKAYPDPDYRHWAETTWKTTLEKAKQEQVDFPPIEVTVRCKNNSIKTVLVAAAAAIQHDFTGMHLVVLYDITQRKQIEAELTRSIADLEQFAYAVSHDMRQPLRMVTSYLSLIESALTGQMDEETQQFLEFAVNGAKRMDAMILSLLDYSRIGRKFEAKTRISSKASLDEALAFLNPELDACGGEIKVTGDWPELFASRDELTRLLQNLVGNALKYHEENQPPQVHVHGKISAESLRVEVRDQGIGIEPSQMDRLFKVFSRLQARSRFEGTGVGLALCRKIVEHHGGTIGVESAGEGQGSVFWFELPIVNAANSE
ncbi:MAG: PAS domain S-box protein, partial [Methylobacter sp.]|nr:PAS domain S-box protein [Methylobacter sp.]